MARSRALLIWGALLLAIALPIAAAAQSPLLAWRQPIYIAAGFAGIVAMALLLLQPLLMGNLLPGLQGAVGRKAHRWIGAILVLAVLAHILGLWITSPPDVIDVLLFRSPTPFSLWGAFAMWAVFAAAVLALFRRRLKPTTWRLAHTALVLITVSTSIAHALLIEGTMETVTKALLCALVLAATLYAIAKRRAWAAFTRR